MDPVFYMSQLAFIIVEIVCIVGLGATCVLLLSMLIREIKNKTLW